MIKEPVITPTIVEEETSQTMVEKTSANPEAGNKMPSTPVLQHRKYIYATIAEDQFKNKQSLLTHYKNQRKESVVQAQKQLSDLIHKSDEKVTLMTVRDATTGSLSLAPLEIMLPTDAKIFQILSTMCDHFNATTPVAGPSYDNK